MSMSEHERLYNPSQWSKRFQPEQLMVYFLNLSNKGTLEARKKIPCQLDLSYGSTKFSKYDVYGTHLPNDAPILMLIHGGYWHEGSKDLTGFIVPTFVSKGIRVIAIGYDLCPNVRLSEIVSQIKVATEHILKYAQDLGSRTVWVAGHSAGAHLTAGLMYDEAWLRSLIKKQYRNLLKGLILIGGIYRLEPLLDVSVNDILKLNDEEIKNLSFCHVEVKHTDLIHDLKVVVAVGECDSPVFIDESRKYAQKLTTMVDNVEYILLRDNIDHFDIVEKLVDENFCFMKLLLQKILSN